MGVTSQRTFDFPADTHHYTLAWCHPLTVRKTLVGSFQEAQLTLYWAAGIYYSSLMYHPWMLFHYFAISKTVKSSSGHIWWWLWVTNIPKSVYFKQHYPSSRSDHSEIFSWTLNNSAGLFAPRTPAKCYLSSDNEKCCEVKEVIWKKINPCKSAADGETWVWIDISHVLQTHSALAI